MIQNICKGGGRYVLFADKMGRVGFGIVFKARRLKICVSITNSFS